MKPKFRTYTSLLPAVVLLGTAWQTHAAFTAVDTFNARTNGNINAQGGWIATDATTALVIVDPGNPINKILHHTGAGDAGLPLPANIAESSTGTYFFRVKRVSANSDLSFGLSDVVAASGGVGNFGNFEVQPNIVGVPLRGRDDTSVQNVVPTMATTAWYKVWLVVNNVTGATKAGATGDHYKFYVQSSDDLTYQTQTEYFPTGDAIWNFRNGTTTALVTAQFTSNSGNTSVYFDDLYIDNSGQNLADPTVVSNPDSDGDGLEDAWEVFYFTTITTQIGTDGATGGDNDGLNNEAEETLGTHPGVADTDGDGLNDGPEDSGTANPAFGNERTDPKLADTDGDGATDGQEVNGTLNVAFANAPTDPNMADSDLDTWSDKQEMTYGTDPNSNSSAPTVHELVGLTKRNGSFENRNGVAAPTNFKLGWDAVGDDIDNWTTWTEHTTTSTDSGVETGGMTHGAVKGFCQNGNGAKNMTPYKAKEGDILSVTYDQVNGYTSGSTYLTYDGTDLGAGFVQIPTSPAQILRPNGHYNITFKVPAGSPAIGRAIGVGIRNGGVASTWPGWDSVIVTVQDRDSDGDNLSDFAEDRYFGDNDDNPSTSELAVTTGGVDYDGDGTTNADEVAAGSNPNNINSTPADLDGDSLADDWEMSYFFSIAAQNGSGDPDGDFNSNEIEETTATDPMSAASWPDSEPDTLNDGWEKHYFTNSLAQVPTGDPDGDGFNNLAEMAAGSHPDDSAWSPSVPKLVHRWSFNGSLNDSVGASPAVIQNDTPANLGLSNTLGAADLTLAGGAKATTDWVKLGANLIGGKKTPVTIELWATQNAAQNWSRIFDFHSAATETLYMSWTQGVVPASDRVQWIDAVTTLPSDNTNAPYVLGTKYHIVMTLVPALNSGGAAANGAIASWYTKAAGSGLLGPAKGTLITPNSAMSLNDVIDSLGRSAFADNNANATYDEVRIWDGSLPTGARETLHAAGPGNPSLADGDGDGLYDAWELAFFPNLTTATGNGNGGGSPNSDADSATNLEEQAAGSNPMVAASIPGDVDGDTLADEWELNYFADLEETATGDPDGDYDTNGFEEDQATDPTSKLSYFSATSDTVSDSWKAHFGIASQTGADDLEAGLPVGDGMTNETEFARGTSPIDRDSDDDGLEDGPEVTATTNPLVKDTDGDGLWDGPEVNEHSTSPLSQDTDNDHFGDFFEVSNPGGNPTNPAVHPSQPAGWTALENFEGSGMTLGQTFNGVNGWTADAATSLVAADPANSGNKVGVWGNGNIAKLLANPGLTILEGATGSLFFQMYVPVGQTLDRSVTLSDTGLDYFQGEAAMGFLGGSLFGRNPGGTDTTFDYPQGQWVNCWIVANTLTDRYDMWVETPVGQTGKVQIATSFIFRNSGAGLQTSPLVSFVGGNFNVTTAYVDNIHIDPTGANTTNPLGTAGDSDSDGMADAWEETYFGTGNLAQTATDDFDLDGTDNLSEFRLGLIPNKGSSAFVATRSGAGTIQWPSAPGTTFKIERSTNLTSWSTLQASYAAAAGPANSTSYTDPALPPGKAFYKITLNP